MYDDARVDQAFPHVRLDGSYGWVIEKFTDEMEYFLSSCYCLHLHLKHSLHVLSSSSLLIYFSTFSYLFNHVSIIASHLSNCLTNGNKSPSSVMLVVIYYIYYNSWPNFPQRSWICNSWNWIICFYYHIERVIDKCPVGSRIFQHSQALQKIGFIKLCEIEFSFGRWLPRSMLISSPSHFFMFWNRKKSQIDKLRMRRNSWSNGTAIFSWLSAVVFSSLRRQMFFPYPNGRWRLWVLHLRKRRS